MTNRHPQQFKANLDPAFIEFKTFDEREFIVAPCVGIVPGVMNRSLVTLAAIEGTMNAWNNRPIVINHPENEDGVAVSANEPPILESVGIGALFYTNTEDDRLKFEAWVDVEKAKRLGGEAALLVQRLESKAPTEVSTGYWAVSREQSGVFNGEEYDDIVDLIIPDHLAFLPNDIGACSWGDGCGVPRVNEQIPLLDEDEMKETAKQAGATVETNITIIDQFAMISRLVAMEMQEEGLDFWQWYVEDIEDSSAIIMKQGMLMKRPFTITDSENIEWAGEWEEVTRKTTFTAASAGSVCACGGKISIEEPSTMAEPNDKQEQETVDTLAVFLSDCGLTEGELTLILQERQQARSEKIGKIESFTQMKRADIEQLSDDSLDKLIELNANSGQAPNGTIPGQPVDERTFVPANQADLTDFSARGNASTPPPNSGTHPRRGVLKSTRSKSIQKSA